MRRGIPLLIASLVGLMLIAQVSAAPPDHAAVNRTFTAQLDPGQEVIDVPVVSDARGRATFRVNKDGTAIQFRLTVANIENVTQAHIHMGEAGTNGPVVVWLYPSEPPAQLIPGKTGGVLASGVITGDDLVGQWAVDNEHDLKALIELMETGRAYVNVHTSQYPTGEIRGQIH